MSTIKTNNFTNIAGDTTVSMSGGSLVTTDVKLTTINSGPVAGTRNKIINGAMEIDQRNAGSSVSLNNTFSYINDRWIAQATGGSGTGTATAQRVADAPPGFTYSLKYTVTNAKTPAAGDIFYIIQQIEGQNVTDFAFGTASAKTITLSFWVKCSLTGTFSGRILNYNGTTSRAYVFNYTINAANTWQYVTITATGDTGQVPSIDNTIGSQVSFDLGSGSNYQTSTLNSWQTTSASRSTTSVNLISTLNATFQVTGVQLEIGTQATPFERRSYGQELALCQRYFETSYPAGTAVGAATSAVGVGGISLNAGDLYTSYSPTPFVAVKRASPTITIYAGTTGQTGVLYNNSLGTVQGNAGTRFVSQYGFCLYCANNAMSSANAFSVNFTASAEL